MANGLKSQMSNGGKRWKCKHIALISGFSHQLGKRVVKKSLRNKGMAVYSVRSDNDRCKRDILAPYFVISRLV